MSSFTFLEHLFFYFQIKQHYSGLVYKCFDCYLFGMRPLTHIEGNSKQFTGTTLSVPCGGEVVGEEGLFTIFVREMSLMHHEKLHFSWTMY